MDAPQKTETIPPTPEQLLTLLDLQMAQERSKRASKSRNRATLLITALLLMVIVVAAAVLVAQEMVSEVRGRALHADEITAER